MLEDKTHDSGKPQSHPDALRSSRYDVARLGERLRTLRLDKDLTLSRLAELSDVPASTISKIERGLLKPSLVHMINLASALGENLGFLVDRYRGEPADMAVVRSGDRDVIDYPEMGLSLADLNGNFHSGILEARIGVIESGSTSGSDAMSHSGEEFCYVLDGAIRYEIDGETVELASGDSVHFKCSLSHRWINIASGETTVLWVFSDGLSF